MKIQFTKYQGTGNDFIMIDDRSKQLNLNIAQITKICDRKMGIGADGLILIREHSNSDFEMVYYNSDGSQSLCGNGSRCAVNFALSLGIVNEKAEFMTIDGVYSATIEQDIVHLNMKDISGITFKDPDYYIHNGSPHHIIFQTNVQSTDVKSEGRAVRNSAPYKAEGTNVNFVQVVNENEIFVRTYERGVEDETLSCGTGVTAASLASIRQGVSSPVKVKTLGGYLSVSYKQTEKDTFSEIVLSGPAVKVFEGKYELPD